MIVTIKNNDLELKIDTMGAQMMSLKAGDTQFLWQGDPTYWPDRAPTLFPLIGRLWNNSYKYHGKSYAMYIHGFAASSEFCVAEQEEEYVVLSLTRSAETLAQYPFDFKLRITYRLLGNKVEIAYNVQNEDSETMPFGIGGHPGFRVPFEEGTQFEDYYLEFPLECQPDRVDFTPEVYVSGQDERFLLEQGHFLRLRHELFDEDAIILKNMSREVYLRVPKSKYYVCISYPQMDYLGIWHWPKTDAPYVCIEPWSSLPGRHGVVEEFACKSDLIHLQAGASYENTWSITIGEN